MINWFKDGWRVAPLGVLSLIWSYVFYVYDFTFAILEGGVFWWVVTLIMLGLVALNSFFIEQAIQHDHKRKAREEKYKNYYREDPKLDW